MRPTNARPSCDQAGLESRTIVYAIRQTSAVAASAAAPATVWSDRSPGRKRLPVRRGASTTSNESGVDLRDRLLRDDEDRLRNRLEEKLRPGLLALRNRPEQELAQLLRLRRLRRHDHVGVGRDRIGQRELLRRVDDRERVR